MATLKEKTPSLLANGFHSEKGVWFYEKRKRLQLDFSYGSIRGQVAAKCADHDDAEAERMVHVKFQARAAELKG